MSRIKAQSSGGEIYFEHQQNYDGAVLGGGRDLNQFHCPLHGGPDPEHHPQHLQLRRERPADRQPEAGHGGGGVHHLVHAGVHPEVCLQPQQVAVCQGGNERDRCVGHPAILCVLISDRIKQELPAIRRCQKNSSSVQDNENLEDIQARKTLHRIAKFRIHSEKLLQRVRTFDVVPCHGCSHFLESVLFCGEGRGRHGLPEHPRDFLVGHHHHVYRGLR